jgi:hypothetical protein
MSQGVVCDAMSEPPAWIEVPILQTSPISVPEYGILQWSLPEDGSTSTLTYTYPGGAPVSLATSFQRVRGIYAGHLASSDYVLLFGTNYVPAGHGDQASAWCVLQIDLSSPSTPTLSLGESASLDPLLPGYAAIDLVNSLLLVMDLRAERVVFAPWTATSVANLPNPSTFQPVPSPSSTLLLGRPHGLAFASGYVDNPGWRIIPTVGDPGSNERYIDLSAPGSPTLVELPGSSARLWLRGIQGNAVTGFECAWRDGPTGYPATIELLDEAGSVLDSATVTNQTPVLVGDGSQLLSQLTAVCQVRAGSQLRPLLPYLSFGEPNDVLGSTLSKGEIIVTDVYVGSEIAATGVTVNAPAVNAELPAWILVAMVADVASLPLITVGSQVLLDLGSASVVASGFNYGLMTPTRSMGRRLAIPSDPLLEGSILAFQYVVQISPTEFLVSDVFGAAIRPSPQFMQSLSSGPSQRGSGGATSQAGGDAGRSRESFLSAIGSIDGSRRIRFRSVLDFLRRRGR